MHEWNPPAEHDLPDAWIIEEAERARRSPETGENEARLPLDGDGGFRPEPPKAEPPRVIIFDISPG